MHIEYLNLPEIPDHLLHSISEILAMDRRRTPLMDQYRNYENKFVKPELITWLKSNVFDFLFRCHYQVIYPGISIHKDPGRDIAFNYILEPGGNIARALIYDDDMKTVLEDKIIPKYVWHRFNVSKYHTVLDMDLSMLRVAITVEPVDRFCTALHYKSVKA